jgi:hypothetical protein
MDYIIFFKTTINIFIKILPIIFYGGAIMSGLVFDDYRGIILFVGLLMNDFISLGYRQILNAVSNPKCAILKFGETDFVLPSPVSQSIGFVSGFLLTKMYYDMEFKPLSFFLIFIFNLIGIWSMGNTECLSLLDAGFSSLVGLLLGLVYFSIVKDYYKATLIKKETIIDELDDNFFKLD